MPLKQWIIRFFLHSVTILVAYTAQFEHTILNILFEFGMCIKPILKMWIENLLTNNFPLYEYHQAGANRFGGENQTTGRPHEPPLYDPFNYWQFWAKRRRWPYHFGYGARMHYSLNINKYSLHSILNAFELFCIHNCLVSACLAVTDTILAHFSSNLSSLV